MKHDYTHYEVKDVAGKLASGFLNSPLTALLGAFLIILGVIAFLITPKEENPQMVVAGSAVIIAMPGATASEIQKAIIEPLEHKMREIKGIEHIYATAMDNVGMVNVSFFIGENKDESNLKVYDKIMQNSDIFPKGAMNPIIKPLDIDTDIPILTFAFYAKDPAVSQTQLYKKVKDVQHKLYGIENVAVTATMGGQKEQFNILVDLDKLSAYHLSLGQILESVKSLTTNVPDVKNHTENGELIVFGIKNALENVEDLKHIIVASYQGSVIHLGDIASVEKGYDVQNQKAAYISTKVDGNFTELQEQVTLTVSKIQGSNAVTIASEALEVLNEMKTELHDSGVYFTVTRNDGDRANDAVNELMFHLVISIIIIAVLLVFVLGWKESVIVTFTVPAILSITLFVAFMTDQTINRITLFALLLSLGLLVDAAIIVIENIHRHLHDHASKDKTMEEIVIEATDEIGAPTNIATLAIVFTMVPMAFVGQMMGEFMKPIPANVPVALIASLFVAYIFTPYLANKMLRKPDKYHSDDKTN